jgi:hypothetical protein
MYRFKSHSWTVQELEMWKPLWYRFWALGMKWEWQSGDLYANPLGTVAWAVTSLSSLPKTPIPLPSFDTICNMGSAVFEEDRTLYYDVQDFLNLVQAV